MLAPGVEDPQRSKAGREVEALAHRAAGGDARAVEALIERYLPDLRAFVRLRAGAVVRAREESSDLVQSTCREVLEHIDRFQFPSEAAFKQWLYTTALRKIINRRDFYVAQKRDALREVPIGDASDANEELLRAYRSFSSPSRRAMVREEVERIERAFETLPDEYREVITLAHVVGLSRAEIAQQMQKSEGAVRVLLHRALAKVSSLLAEPGETGT
jgi:RNA polymerase sigma-70 factor (ECF subfamily)